MTNNNRIPDEAVEAAKAAYAESLDDMRAALEAAAPHITGHAVAYLTESERMISSDPEVTDYERGFDDAIRGMSAKVKRLLNGEAQ